MPTRLLLFYSLHLSDLDCKLFLAFGQEAPAVAKKQEAGIDPTVKFQHHHPDALGTS